jgi:hypothetical protein
MERHYTKSTLFFLSHYQPTIKHLINCNTHESMTLHDCKEYAQVNYLLNEMKKKMLHKTMKKNAIVNVCCISASNTNGKNVIV